MSAIKSINILKRSSNTFRLRIEATERDANGQRVFSYETVHGSAGDAERRRAELLVGAGAAAPAGGPAGGPTLEEYFSKWIAEREALKTLEPGSVTQYRIGMEKHILPCLGHRPVGSISQPELRAHFAVLASKMKPATLQNVKTKLSSVFTSAIADGVAPANPCKGMKIARVKMSAGRIMTDDERRVLLDKAKDHRLGPIIRFAMSTGMRRGEIAGLLWRDVNLDKGVITVTGQMRGQGEAYERTETLKTEASKRTIGLPPSVVQELRQALVEAELAAKLRNVDVKTQPVFMDGSARPWKPNSLTQAIKRVLSSAGLQDFHLHDMRHIHASHLLQGKHNLKAVSVRLGHSDPRITLAVYSHVMPQDDEALAAASGGILEG